MIDLRKKVAATAEHLEQCLRCSRDKGHVPGLLFYHTHPNYGQSHIYLTEDDSVEPEDEVLGQPIDYVIDYEGWTDATTWWEGESTTGELELTLLDGLTVQTTTNEEFNAVWAQQVEVLIREALHPMDPSLLPKRVVVCAENGEHRADWRP